MYLKAKTFADQSTMQMIMRSEDPAQAKKLGLEVAGFDENVWREKRYECVFQAVWNKFSQDNELSKLLLSTGEKYLAESAGYDPLFGLALWEYKQGASKGIKVDDTTFDVLPENWPGVNLLGIALMGA